jgi:ribonuclease HII
MLKICFSEGRVEAGCDEAGRGCLAGPVFAAAVILPAGYSNPALDDSKKLTAEMRFSLRPEIEKEALAWAVAEVSAAEIDKINILNASILAMHKAIRQLSVRPQLLIIDGNRFKPFADIPHCCIIKGDGQYMSIAAASILAKCYRDEYMERIHRDYPVYDWENNKGYGAKKHRDAIFEFGLCEHHRRSFQMGQQLRLEL